MVVITYPDTPLDQQTYNFPCLVASGHKDLVGQRRMNEKEFMLDVRSLLQTYSSDRKNNETENLIFLDKPKDKMNS